MNTEPAQDTIRQGTVMLREMKNDGSYLHFEGMTWPNPDDPAERGWRLIHGAPTRADVYWAVSCIEAYRQLVTDPGRVRDKRVAAIRFRAAAGVTPEGTKP